MGTALHLDVSHQGMRQGRLIFVWGVRRRGQPPLSDERGAVPPAQAFFPCKVSGSRERNGGEEVGVRWRVVTAAACADGHRTAA